MSDGFLGGVAVYAVLLLGIGATVFSARYLLQRWRFRQRETLSTQEVVALFVSGAAEEQQLVLDVLRALSRNVCLPVGKFRPADSLKIVAIPWKWISGDGLDAFDDDVLMIVGRYGFRPPKSNLADANLDRLVRVLVSAYRDSKSVAWPGQDLVR